MDGATTQPIAITLPTLATASCAPSASAPAPSGVQLPITFDGKIGSVTQVALGDQASQSLAALLARDAAFVAGVQSQNIQQAANAAVNVFKANLRSIPIKPNAPTASAIPTLHPSSQGQADAQKQQAELSAKQRNDAAHTLKPGDRITVAAGNRKMQPELVGQEGEVKEVMPSGWVRVHLPALNSIYEIQPRCLTPVGAKDAVGEQLRQGSIQLQDLPAPRPVALAPQAGRPAKVARTSSRGGGTLKASDVLGTVRTELLALEEEVPWSAVVDKWRAARPKWRSGLMRAEGSVADLAQRIRELLDALKVDRRSGPFAAGGPLLASLQDCITGRAGHAVLDQAWQELCCAVRSWLGAQNPQQVQPEVPSSREAYSSAARGFSVLHDAAGKGHAHLEQVPLDSMVGRDGLLALHSMVERERAQALGQIQGLNAGGLGPEDLFLDGFGFLEQGFKTGLLTEAGVLGAGLLMDGVDTEDDSGSEATDLGGEGLAF